MDVVIHPALKHYNTYVNILFDLAGDFVQVPPPDLTDYLLDPNVRRALRTAKKHNVQAEAWKAFEQSILDKSSS